MDDSSYRFPRDLALVVSDRWNNLVAGDYSPPACPPTEMLRHLFEVSYLAANCPEEARFPRFNIIATPKNTDVKPDGFNLIRFDELRPFSVQEVRRLAPSVDLAKSSIWVGWDDDGWSIVGMVDLGTSWHRAKNGLSYRYRAPRDLFVQVDRPGRVKVNQGPYHIATLEDGFITGDNGIDLGLFFHPIAASGIRSLEKSIEYPAYELPREFSDFEFIALINTYSAIAAEISTGRHGGTIIFNLEYDADALEELRIKYPCRSSILREAFVTFMSARNVQGDYGALYDDGHGVPDSELNNAEIVSRDAYDALVEATRFVAGLSGCDGAIVLQSDLTLIGFGAEILSDIEGSVDIVEGKAEFPDDLQECNIQQFGMRHRSAVKLASRTDAYRVIAVSQDGPISGIYKKGERVFVEKGISTTNRNLPWA